MTENFKQLDSFGEITMSWGVFENFLQAGVRRKINRIIPFFSTIFQNTKSLQVLKLSDGLATEL